MPTPEVRILSLAILLLAGLQIGLPWAVGGRSPAGQAGLVLLLLLAGAAVSLPRGERPLLRPLPWLLLAGILVGGSALHTLYPDRTVQSLLLLLAYLLAGTLAARGVRELPWAEGVLLLAILVSAVLISGLGMIRLLQGSGTGVYAGLLTGPFGYPNGLAGFLLLTGGAALVSAREDHGPLIRGGVILAGAISVLGILLTGSRGAALAAAVGFALWAAIERRTWWPRQRLSRWVGGAGLLILLAVVSSRVSQVLTDSSTLWRLHMVRWTWAMAWDQPWWGVGPGAFPVALKQYQRLPYVSGENPHNLYLELAAEYGLPAGILAVLGLGLFFGRMGLAIRRGSGGDPARRRLAGFLATLVAFAIHSAMDLDWSFPAIALTAATIFGLASGNLEEKEQRRSWVEPIWRRALLVLLMAAAVLSLTRYYASSLVTRARFALASGEAAAAQRSLAWALRLNPLGFPALLWTARTRLASGDSPGAIEVAERAVRLAPSDPDSLYLAGEVALAAGRREEGRARFQRAADLAPYAQLRYHAALVEAAVRTGRAEEARRWYDRATAIFGPGRVLGEDARCLAPGDRYLLARMSRLAAQAEAGDPPRQQVLNERARLLAQPDPRGICVARGRPGQTSPEKAAESFWRALTGGGWPEAERLVVPELRGPRPGNGAWGKLERPLRAGVAWIAALSGGEQQVSLRLQVEIEFPPGPPIPHCVQMDLRLIGEDWFVDGIPIPEPAPCHP